MRNRALTAFTAAVVAVTLAGCGSAAEEGQAGSSGHDDQTGSAAPAEQDGAGHNQADIAFVHGMNPHHGQALEMSKAARSRAQSPQVKELADRIEAAQGPEIATMQGWLRRWGAAPQSGMEGMHHGEAAGMGQTMSAEQMDRLTAASGAEFDRMFLEMMIEHHQGAVEMARTEIATGRNADAVQLARHIVDTQQDEIGQMRTLLTQL